MNIKKSIATICILFSMITFVQAQNSIDYTVKEWERAKAFTKEYLEAMPDSG